jgi:hypothetical protein
MKEIGGYFELELQERQEYHKKALKLNSGRNCLKYILKTQEVAKIYIPNFICDSMIEPLEELNIEYEFYNIDEKFEIIDNIELKVNEKFLYVNYYALKSNYINYLSNRYGTKLIVDNTQDFFALPGENIDTIYSPRKFFGVSDGGYLYTNQLVNELFKEDLSEKYSQLIGRIENGASPHYDKYQQAEQSLTCSPLKSMSKLTTRILASIDYENVKKKRECNFHYLHSQLKEYNKLEIDLTNVKAPFSYPFISDNNQLREHLIRNKVYVAKYWSEVLDRVTVNNNEKKLVNNIVSLPIDQRYGLEDMKRIIAEIKSVSHV